MDAPKVATTRLDVDLGERSYPIFIGPGLLGDGVCVRAGLRGREVLVVSNDTVAPLYLDPLLANLGEDARAGLGHGAAIATRAECAVDMSFTRRNRQGVQHLVEQHGDMRRGAHLPPPAARWSSQRWTLLRISAGRSGLSTRASGFQIWK